jgi:hypothetical protein
LHTRSVFSGLLRPCNDSNDSNDDSAAVFVLPKPRGATVNWTVVSFGRYAGQTLPQIVFRDPDWFFWACENGAFRDALADEARHVYERARRIRLPQRWDGPRVVEYTDCARGKFAVLEAVPESRNLHARSFRRPWIDLGYAHCACPYDKGGSRRLVRQAKYYLFGSASYPLTRKRAEAFFEDDENFELSAPATRVRRAEDCVGEG